MAQWRSHYGWLLLVTVTNIISAVEKTIGSRWYVIWRDAMPKPRCWYGNSYCPGNGSNVTKYDCIDWMPVWYWRDDYYWRLTIVVTYSAKLTDDGNTWWLTSTSIIPHWLLCNTLQWHYWRSGRRLISPDEADWPCQMTASYSGYIDPTWTVTWGQPDNEENNGRTYWPINIIIIRNAIIINNLSIGNITKLPMTNYY